MLVTDQCVEHLAAVKAFAARTNQTEQLEDKLQYLAAYAIHEGDPDDKTKCLLFKDFAPYSFEFVMQLKQADGSFKRWFNGGLIYHGAHDGGGNGGAPTFSVNLTAVQGWEVHT